MQIIEMQVIEKKNVHAGAGLVKTGEADRQG